MKGERRHGWVVLDKPAGMGSTQALAFVRRIVGAAKAGHIGTLDPFATGVLPMAFGEATKLIPYLEDGRKVYEFTLQFGFSTTTDDIEGEALERSEVMPGRAALEAALGEFLGKIRQVPPVYSAIKIDGKRAYALARAGEKVEMPEREVEVFSLELLDYSESARQATFSVECSKGTYVRTLGRDLAVRLGSRGHLAALRRIKNGKFGLGDALRLEICEKGGYKLSPDKGLSDFSTGLRDIAVLAVSAEDAARLKAGQGLSPRGFEASEGIAVAIAEGEPAAIVRIDARKIAPVRVFNL